MSMESKMDKDTFEIERLNLFRDYGFEASGRYLRDGDGNETYVLEGGQGHSPVLLIHGGLSESGQWFKIAGQLNCRTILADRPGCGLSHGVDYRGQDYFAAAVRWVDFLANALEIEKLTIVANSMGGYFALAFALSHPERVARLILVGAPAGIDRYIPLPLRVWGNPVTGPVVGRIIKATKSPETMRRKVFPILTAHPERLPLQFLRVALGARKLPGAAIGAYSMLRTVLDTGGWRPEMSIRHRVASLAVPTRFIWGERDAFAPPSSGADLSERMPDASVVVLEDAGHLPHLDRPDATADAIKTALENTGKQRRRLVS